MEIYEVFCLVNVHLAGGDVAQAIGEGAVVMSMRNTRRVRYAIGSRLHVHFDHAQLR